MTKKTLTMKERYTVMQYIEAHCLKKPDDKYAIWDGIAQNDQHVADLFKPSIPNIQHNHVMKMRQEMDLLLEPSRFFTKIRMEQQRSLEDLNAEIVRLNEVIVAHEARLSALEDRYTAPKDDEPSNELEQLALLGTPSMDRMINRAAGKAVSEVIDPLLPKTFPGYKYQKGKHHR